MNERIRELEKQAIEYSWNQRNTELDLDAIMREKFAELIVQECIAQASISNGHGNNQWDKALTFAADNIKKHFGVEE